ncbi:MAG: NAD-dependent epimerase/dehydratase family protein [Nitrospira sp.]|nr:MAG: NAD-dependent epimerase/dehydratase family protein [Nitrospira sp.]
MDKWVKTGLLGANSLVGECIIPRLRDDGRHTVAFSRHPSGDEPDPGVTWLQLRASLPAYPEVPSITQWLCVAPIWVLPQYFGMIKTSGARRVVALSSTSLFIKKESSDSGEQHIAQRLAEGERALCTWAEAHGIEWVILRPTLIYGRGRDKNLTEIARFVRRWGFFPLLGQAEGLRQPVQAEDVAAACVSALTRPAAANRAYNLSGGETLSYREMVSRIFGAIGKSPRLVTIPRWLFRLAVTTVNLMPRYRHWTMEMAERMNRDLVFDHAEAARDLGYSPGLFQLLTHDIPA